MIPLFLLSGFLQTYTFKSWNEHEYEIKILKIIDVDIYIYLRGTNVVQKVTFDWLMLKFPIQFHNFIAYKFITIFQFSIFQNVISQNYETLCNDIIHTYVDNVRRHAYVEVKSKLQNTLNDDKTLKNSDY